MPIVSITSAKSDNTGIVDNQYIEEVYTTPVSERLLFSLLTQIRENEADVFAIFVAFVTKSISNSFASSKVSAIASQTSNISTSSRVTASSKFTASFNNSASSNVSDVIGNSEFKANYNGISTSNSITTAETYLAALFTGRSRQNRIRFAGGNRVSENVGQFMPIVFYGGSCFTFTTPKARLKRIIPDFRKFGGLSNSITSVSAEVELTNISTGTGVQPPIETEIMSNSTVISTANSTTSIAVIDGTIYKIAKLTVDVRRPNYALTNEIHIVTLGSDVNFTVFANMELGNSVDIVYNVFVNQSGNIVLTATQPDSVETNYTVYWSSVKTPTQN